MLRFFKLWPLTLVFIVLVLYAFFLDRRLQDQEATGYFPKKATYVARVVREQAFYDDRSQYVIQTQRHIAPLFGEGKEIALLTVGTPCVLPPGATIVFNARLAPARTYLNPGVFDYKHFLKRQGIFLKAFVDTCDGVHIQELRVPAWRQKFLASFRHELWTKTKHAPLLSALILGTNTISPEKKDEIKSFGLSHLFVISGMHFGMMVLAIFFSVSALFNLVPKIYLVIPRQKIAAFFSLLFTVFYTVLVNSHPSVWRGAVVASVFLLAIILERQRHFFYTLLISAVIVLALNPLDIFDVSFHLSYLCVLILATVVSRFSAKRSPIFNLVVTTVLLTVFLIPYILFVFKEAALSGVIHNIWAVPYFQFIVMPLALVTLLSFTFHLPVFTPALSLWDGSLEIFNKILTGAAAWKIPVLDTAAPHVEHVLFFYLFIFSFFFLKRRAVPIFILCLLLFSLVFTYLHNHTGYDVRISQIDVGQGDAELIQTPTHNILIDTGGSAYFDTGKFVLRPLFKHLWVMDIDLLILTHADLDHVGGAAGLLDDFNIHEVWVNGKTGQGEHYALLLEKIREKGILLKKIDHPMTAQLGALILRVVNPLENLLPSEADNDFSIVVKISRDKFAALFTGDISARTEKKLVASFGAELKSQVLKIPHHGSRGSTSLSLLRAVEPQLALIGVGRNSRFGHPHGKVIDSLQKRGIGIYRTDRDGFVQLSVEDSAVTGVYTYRATSRAF